MVQDLAWVAPTPHISSITVRPEDIDDFKHVNNVVYLGWMSRAAWNHSKALGFDFARYQALDVGFVVKRHEIDYRNAAMLGETIAVATWITGNDGRLSLRRRFQMQSLERQICLAYGLSDFVTMKISTGKACRMPDAFATGYPVQAGVEELFAKLRR